MEMKKLGLHISIETNGTIPVDPIVDWICVSPKDQLYPDAVIRQRSGNELKVVYCGQDLSMYDELRTGSSIISCNLVYGGGVSGVKWVII